MKTIGLIGGLSPESTALYYQYMNQLARKRLGGLHSARILLYSVDFEEFVALAKAGDWTTTTRRMIDIARRLETAGADGLIIGANTIHKIAEEVQAAIGIPLLHIADATGAGIQARGLKTVALLGTKFTMEGEFIQDRLAARFGIRTIAPAARERQWIHETIYNELCHGTIREETKRGYQALIAGMQEQGAEGIILGCTEIPLIVHQSDYKIPLFDTTFLHAQAAVAFAIP